MEIQIFCTPFPVFPPKNGFKSKKDEAEEPLSLQYFFMVGGSSGALSLPLKLVLCKNTRKRSGQIRNFNFRKF